MTKCLICKGEIEPFISFGQMPIANGFLREEDFENEFYFTLGVGYCSICHNVQLTELVDPSKLFHENYAYLSSISVRMAQHFQRFAEMIQKSYLITEDPFVVEIGSNDGIMLHNFSNAGIRHLGVEPSANAAAVAQSKGVQSIVRFFNEETAQWILQEHGRADVILGANVICHIPDLHSVLKGINILLKDRGVFVFEEPYVADIVSKISYDQFYDEHVFYFSLNSVTYLLNQYDMELIDVMPQPVHGGSMRYVVARKGAWPVGERVATQLALEKELKITEKETYLQLRDRILKSREELVELLQSLKKMNKSVVGYGATSKSTTITNFCNIHSDLIHYISDTMPRKQGKHNPGTHIPIRPYDHFKKNPPDYALLFAWNHAEEIIAKEKAFIAGGGKFIVYVPTVTVLNSE